MSAVLSFRSEAREVLGSEAPPNGRRLLTSMPQSVNQINRVLEKHGSEHRIVSWYLPRLCDERQ
jgi:hypothetical protein